MAKRRGFTITVKVSDEPVDVDAFLDRYAQVVIEQYEAEQRASDSTMTPLLATNDATNSCD